KSRTNRTRATRRALLLENLEGRALMAGDVTVAVTNGILTIHGDDAANGVQIRQVLIKPTTDGGTPTVKLGVIGMPNGDAPTTINGKADPFLIGADGLTGVSIELAGGNDALGFFNPPPTST